MLIKKKVQKKKKKKTPENKFPMHVFSKKEIEN